MGVYDFRDLDFLSIYKLIINVNYIDIKPKF